MQYRGVSRYLTQRLAAKGETPASMSRPKGWGEAYISNIINGQSRPSQKRSIEIAEFFSDDPNIILSLAGYYVPPKNDHFEYITLLESLSPSSQEAALDFLHYLKWREDH